MYIRPFGDAYSYLVNENGAVIVAFLPDGLGTVLYYENGTEHVFSKGFDDESELVRTFGYIGIVSTFDDPVLTFNYGGIEYKWDASTQILNPNVTDIFPD